MTSFKTALQTTSRTKWLLIALLIGALIGCSPNVISDTEGRRGMARDATGLTDALKRIPGARYHLIPGSADTAGHGTTGQARFYKDQLAAFLASVPKR